MVNKKILPVLTLLILAGALGQGRAVGRVSRPQDASADAAEVGGHVSELSSPDPVKRATAACALKRMGARATAAIPSLVGLLADDTSIEPIRCEDVGAYKSSEKTSPGEEAAKALAAMGGAAVAPLSDALGNSNWKVRKVAAWALGEIRSANAADRKVRVERLTAALGDAQWEVRSNAAWALGELRGRTAEGQLITALSDGQPAVRRNAAWALGEVESQAAGDALIAALKDQDWVV